MLFEFAETQAKQNAELASAKSKAYLDNAIVAARNTAGMIQGIIKQGDRGAGVANFQIIIQNVLQSNSNVKSIQLLFNYDLLSTIIPNIQNFGINKISDKVIIPFFPTS
jgi:hypothetical protein